ncbi:fumarylacetoacetate hydrolase family protein [Sphingomonas sp. AR_OL41]|uniref:2-keto-4-pentenoate hydratase n=1 Tax=Sphingomonas sp. AR_OL41 TaxID=3042729 RepID=UPI0024812E65|nr:fumarylacetoacetate hydrolase family protein [Sphingomonas sp. AR_OL41]MDH7972090.1 fumarylacetoacetate hydrolase family protein [Sphingomonas sp. AR_OL41]
MSEAIEHVAAMLREAGERGVPIAPITPLLPDASLDTAYAVQEVNTRAALAAGRRLVGRKIGLTAAAVQRQLGVDQPDYGMLFADMGYDDRADIPVGAVLQPRIEAEVALVLGADLPHERNSLADVIAATAFALPCLEIVGSRIADWKIGILDTIADNASSGAFVLGATPRPLAALDLRLCGMVLEKNGEPTSTGVGQACLGNPLTAARWLADVMARAGRPLRAGDVILSGALGPMTPVVRGDLIEARIAGLGSVAARFV